MNNQDKQTEQIKKSKAEHNSIYKLNKALAHIDIYYYTGSKRLKIGPNVFDFNIGPAISIMKAIQDQFGNGRHNIHIPVLQFCALQDACKDAIGFNEQSVYFTPVFSQRELAMVDGDHKDKCAYYYSAINLIKVADGNKLILTGTPKQVYSILVLINAARNRGMCVDALIKKLSCLHFVGFPAVSQLWQKMNLRERFRLLQAIESKAGIGKTIINLFKAAVKNHG